MKIQNIYTTLHSLQKSQRLYNGSKFDAFLVNLQQSECLKPHASATDAFLIVLEGSMNFFIHNNEYLLKKGDTIFFKAGEVHSANAIDTTAFLLVK